MGTKQVVLSLDEDLVAGAEKILDGIGGMQIGVSIFLSRLVKEGSFMFLLNENKATEPINNERKAETVVEQKTDDDAFYEELEEFSMRSRTKKSITKEMRDYVWFAFKQSNAKSDKINRNAIARAIADKTGMNQGSAFIYIGILINLFDGTINKRNMKFEDLEHYVKCIKLECSEKIFENTLTSLENSIPFWKDYFAGDFAYEVERLVKIYRQNKQ